MTKTTKEVKQRLKEIYKELDDLQNETNNKNTINQICNTLSELELLIWDFRK